MHPVARIIKVVSKPSFATIAQDALFILSQHVSAYLMAIFR
jgi:histone H3/H4